MKIGLSRVLGSQGVLITLFACSISFYAGAVGGPRDMKLEKIERLHGNSWVIKFEGGKPAEVTVISDLDDFSVEVKDKDGNVVFAETDAGDYDGYDDIDEGYIAKAKWSPVETKDYEIFIRNYMKSSKTEKDSRVGRFRLKTN